MGGLEDLFKAEDYQKSAKGSKKGSKPKESKKGSAEKEKKGIRYPLPVRVRSGHICCNLLQEEYGGKTVSETEIKQKIRECYPELSGIQFNLVKFSNKHTDFLEKQGKIEALKLFLPGVEEPEEEEQEQEAVEKGLEFASADQEEDALDEMETTDTEESEYEDSEDSEDSEDDEMSDDESGDGEDDEGEDSKDSEDESSSDVKEVTVKGCWIKLEIHYQELVGDQALIFPVSVAVDSIRMLFGEDTESVEEVRAKWVEAHPEYTGCLFHYDDKQNMLIPFMRGQSEVKGRKYKLPVTVGYLHLAERYEAKVFGTGVTEVTQAQIREVYARKHPEFENAVFAYIEEGNHLFPVMNFKKEGTSDRYGLPIKVRGPGFQMTLEASDFNGKTDVTLEEIRAAIEEIYPEFSKERTEMVYDERGFVIPILKGSRKGITIVSDRAEQSLFFVKGRNGERYRVEQMPYGIFDSRADGREVDFHLCAGKIPGSILGEIVAFFKREPHKEAAVQIFYDTETKEYELYYPEQKVSACSVVFERNTQLEADKVLVMDAHSHGSMKAFFSSIDDHDEKGTRLFLVIGNLNREKPEWKLRAGIAGFYKNLQLSDIFETEDCVYEM